MTTTHRLCIAVLAALALSLAFQSPAWAVRAMTWNIGGGPSNEAVGPRASAGVPFDLGGIDAVVARYHPDVLALQEVCSWQSKSVAQSLGYIQWHETTVHDLNDARPGADGRCDYGDAILARAAGGTGNFRTDLLPPRQCKLSAFDSLVAECRVDLGVLVPVAGSWIRATSAHLGTRFEPYAEGTSDTSQISTLISDATRQESSAILMGDFNVPPEDKRLTPSIAKRGYTEAGGVQPGLACDSTQGCSLTFPAGGAFGAPRLRGDYIWFRGYSLQSGGMHDAGSAYANGNPASDHRPLIADLTPSAPVVTLATPALRSATTNHRPKLSGATAGATGTPVTARLYSGAVATGVPLQTIQVTPAPDGSWSADLPTDLPDGVYTARATWLPATNSSTNTFVVDSTPPSTSMRGATAVTNANPKFDFTSNEPDSWPYEPPPSFECSLDGGAWDTCFPPQRFRNLTEGPHSVAVRATDAAGNAEPGQATHNFTVDATPPATAITSPPESPTATGAYLTFSSSEPGSRFRCRLGGRLKACSSPAIYTPLLPGPHVFEVQALDAVGNPDPRGASISWVTAPRLSRLATLPNPFFVRTGSRGGTVFSYVLSGNATVRLSIESPAAGNLYNGQCLTAPPPAPAPVPVPLPVPPFTAPPEPGPACTAWVSQGQLVRRGRPGTNRAAFPGKLAGRALAIGRYRVVATATDQAGYSGTPRTISLRVRSAPKPKPKPKPRKPRKR